MKHESIYPSIGAEALYTAFFQALPSNSILVSNDAPKFTIIAATPGYLEQTGYTKQAMIGKGVFEAFPANTDPEYTGGSDLLTSYQHVVLHKEPHFLPIQRYDLKNNDGSFTEKYWRISNTPVFAPDGDVAYIIHTSEDITAEVKTGEMNERMKGMEVVNNLFAQAPIPVCLLKGPELIVELANEPTLKLWGRTKEVIGLPLEEAVPEVKEQGYAEMMNEVRETGVTRQVYESPVSLIRNGKQELAYINYVYEPYFEGDHTMAVGVLAIGNDVTDNVLTKQKIAESEAKYRYLFESMDQGFCVLELLYDTDGRPSDYRMLETNPMFEKQTGLKNVAGKKASEVISNVEAHWSQLYHKVAVSGEGIRFIKESGPQGKWYDTYAFKIGGSDSRKVALLFTDITEKKRAEETLRTSGELQSFLLKLSDRLRSLANAGDIQYEAACLLGEHFGANRVGYAEDAGDGDNIIVTRNYTNGVSGIEGQYKYDDYGPQLLKEFRAGNSVVRHNIAEDTTLSDAEKEAHVMLQIGSSINVPMLKEGRLFGILFMHRASAHLWTEREIELIKETADRTWEAVERARTEAALRQSEERFRLMVNAIPQIIWITDAKGKTEFLNKHWCDYCGETYAETTITAMAAKYLHPEDAPKVVEAFETAMQTGEPFEVEQRNRSWKGEYRWFLNRAIPYKDPNTGRVLKWLGVGIDLHDRKLAEQALRQSEEELERKVQERTVELEKANQELKRSNQNLEEFAHAASHDLKEPVRKIYFYTDQLKGQLNKHLQEGQAKAFSRIQHATERMGNLIDDLLLYSHVSHRPHEMESVDLNEMVKGVMEDLELDIEEKKAVIHIDTLPLIKGYRRQLQQVFQNLISNALKYSKPDVNPRIDITASQVLENGLRYHQIAVKDNGIGFEEQYYDKIFQMFARLHGKEKYGGTGVGLSIVKKVAENHNGFIKVESSLGEGSTFKVLFPMNE